MKNVIVTPIVFIIVLFFISCNNHSEEKKSPVSENNNSVSEVVKIKETEDIKIIRDTLFKTSEPFYLNERLCYWEHSIIYLFYIHDVVIHDSIYQTRTMKLRDSKTNKILLEYTHYIKHAEDYNSPDYFDEINKNHFRDLNFDGFKDFFIKSYGSIALTDLTNVYIFNKDTKLSLRLGHSILKYDKLYLPLIINLV